MNPYLARLVNESGVETFAGHVDFSDPTNQPGYGALFLPRTFAETVAGVTYTAQWVLPARTRVLDVLLETVTAWTAATAPLDVGDADAVDALVGAANIAAAFFGSADSGGGTAWGNAAGAGGPYSSSGSGKLYPAGATITAVMTPTVPGGPTGITRVTLVAQLEAPAVAAVVL